MSIDQLRAHWGFTRMPFAKDLAPSMLTVTGAHAEAVARIGWCVQESALGVITGEVGAGKTVAARAALATLDASRHTIIYIGNPAIGARGIYAAIISALGATPRFHKAALIPQAQTLLAAEHDERGKHVIVVCDEAHLLDHDQLERDEKASIAVASNHPFSEWGRTFADPRLVAAVVDRLTFNAHIIETGSDSYRLHTTRTRKKGAAAKN